MTHSTLHQFLFKPTADNRPWPNDRPPQKPRGVPPALVLTGLEGETSLEDVERLCDKFGTIRMINIAVQEVPRPNDGCLENVTDVKTKGSATVYVYFFIYPDAYDAFDSLAKSWQDPQTNRRVRWDSWTRAR